MVNGLCWSWMWVDEALDWDGLKVSGGEWLFLYHFLGSLCIWHHVETGKWKLHHADASSMLM